MQSRLVLPRNIYAYDSLQNIIMYEYLPSLLGTKVEPYSGYKPDVHPGISHVFQSAAFRWVKIHFSPANTKCSQGL